MKLILKTAAVSMLLLASGFTNQALALPKETCELCTIQQYCVFSFCWTDYDCIPIDPKHCEGMV